MGRAPTLMKMLSAVSRTVSPSFRSTSSSFGPVKRASPRNRSRPLVLSIICSAAVAEVIHDVPLALAHFGHVDGYRTVVDAVVRRAAVQVGRPGAGYHRLGRRTAHVYAGAAHVFPLDERGLASGLASALGERVPALAGPYHDGVVVLFGRQKNSSVLLVVGFRAVYPYWRRKPPIRPSRCSRAAASSAP